MAAFRSVEELRRVFGGFLESMRGYEPSTLAGTGLILVYKLTDLDTTVVLDTTVEPKPGAMFDFYVGVPEPANATSIFEMSSDTLDRIFLGTLTPMVALATGRVKARGDYLKSMRTTGALERAVPFYRKWRETEKIETIAPFASAEELKRVFGGFVQEARRRESTIGNLAGSGIIVEFQVTDLKASIIFDASMPPRDGTYFDVYLDDVNAPKPTYCFELTSDTLNRLLLGQLKPVRALLSREIKARGSYLKALKLLPVLGRIAPLYRAYRSSTS